MSDEAKVVSIAIVCVFLFLCWLTFATTESPCIYLNKDKFSGEQLMELCKSGGGRR